MEFVLPSVGFEKNSLQLYDDVAASVISVEGSGDRLEESKTISTDVSRSNRGDRLPLGNMVEANTDSETLECIDGSGGHPIRSIAL